VRRRQVNERVTDVGRALLPAQRAGKRDRAPALMRRKPSPEGGAALERYQTPY